MNPQILEMVDLFSDLKPEQLARIDKLCKEAVYLQGETIFREGSPSEEFYIIIDGEVAIKVDPNLISAGSQHHEHGTIAVLYAGQSFGEVALVDQGLRSASAVCQSASCRTLVINCQDFMRLLKRDTVMGFVVMNNLAADLCTRIRLSNFNLREGLLYMPHKIYGGSPADRSGSDESHL
jgi:CRP-like cAMP-binding protein